MQDKQIRLSLGIYPEIDIQKSRQLHALAKGIDPRVTTCIESVSSSKEGANFKELTLLWLAFKLKN